MADCDQHLMKDILDKITQHVATAKADFSRRAVAQRVGVVTNTTMHEAAGLAECIEPNDGTLVLTVKDPTPMVGAQLFDRPLQDTKTLIVDLRSGSLEPPPQHPDWKLAVAVDQAGADMEISTARWRDARAVIFTRRPLPDIVVQGRGGSIAPPSVEDRLVEVESTLKQLKELLVEQRAEMARKDRRAEDEEETGSHSEQEPVRHGLGRLQQRTLDGQPTSSGGGWSSQQHLQPSSQRTDAIPAQGFPGPHHN